MKALAILHGARSFGSARISIADMPVSTWLRVAAERRRLARLDDKQLADLGLDADAVAREVSRPFWDTARA